MSTEANNDAPETIEVDNDVVKCDGGGALGHPAVYLNTGSAGKIECPYRDREFVLKAGGSH